MAGDHRSIAWLAFLPPIMFAGLVAMFLFGMFREDPDALPSTLVGRVVPDFEVQAVGNLPQLNPDDLKGKGVKIVNFWASWCGPCRVEHPQLLTLAGEGVPVFGINHKDSEANAIAFLEELGDPYVAIGADPKGRGAFEWGVYGIPETFVINGDGKVVLRFAGPITKDVLETRIRPVINPDGFDS